MIGRNMILDAEPIKELFWSHLPSHNRPKAPALQAELNQMDYNRSSIEFFTGISCSRRDYPGYPKRGGRAALGDVLHRV
jgi:hypothetical protein